MTASGSINEELHAIDAPKIWLTRLFQPGTAANRSSVDRIGPSAPVRSNLLADQAFPNHAFLVGTVPHGKSRLNEGQSCEHLGDETSGLTLELGLMIIRSVVKG